MDGEACYLASKVFAGRSIQQWQKQEKPRLVPDWMKRIPTAIASKE